MPHSEFDEIKWKAARKHAEGTREKPRDTDVDTVSQKYRVMHTNLATRKIVFHSKIHYLATKMLLEAASDKPKANLSMHQATKGQAKQAAFA